MWLVACCGLGGAGRDVPRRQQWGPPCPEVGRAAGREHEPRGASQITPFPLRSGFGGCMSEPAAPLWQVLANGCDECSTFSAHPQLAVTQRHLENGKPTPKALAFTSGLVVPVGERPCSRRVLSQPHTVLVGGPHSPRQPGRPTGSGENWCGEAGSRLQQPLSR